MRMKNLKRNTLIILMYNGKEWSGTGKYGILE
jgi:hypothetical protein